METRPSSVTCRSDARLTVDAGDALGDPPRRASNSSVTRRDVERQARGDRLEQLAAPVAVLRRDERAPRDRPAQPPQLAGIEQVALVVHVQRSARRRRRPRRAPHARPPSWRSRSGLAASMTCSSRSASVTSSSVARKAATSVCGRRSMKPTVSETSSSRRSGRRTWRTSGSSVTNSASDASAVVPRQQVEQRGLAGVRVADERHRRDRRFCRRSRSCARRRRTSSICRGRSLDALPDPPPVGFELRLAGAARADAAAQPRQRGAGARPGAAADNAAAPARPAACLPASARAARRCRE